jgi:hypothetical protein
LSKKISPQKWPKKSYFTGASTQNLEGTIFICIAPTIPLKKEPQNWGEAYLTTPKIRMKFSTEPSKSLLEGAKASNNLGLPTPPAKKRRWSWSEENVRNGGGGGAARRGRTRAPLPPPWLVLELLPPSVAPQMMTWARLQ